MRMYELVAEWCRESSSEKDHRVRKWVICDYVRIKERVTLNEK